MNVLLKRIRGTEFSNWLQKLEPVHIEIMCGFSEKFCRGQGEKVKAYYRMVSFFNTAIGKIFRKDVRNLLCGQVLKLLELRQQQKAAAPYR